MDTEIRKIKRRGNPEEEWEIILFDDSENSFLHVINSLMLYCHHGPIQAEQCAMLAHYKGECSIKRGDYKSLLDVSFALRSCNLKTEII